MKVLFSAYCLLSCVVTFGMRSDAEDILFLNGTYDPTPVVYEWQKFLQREGIFVSHEGQPMHQKLLDGVVYLEKALIEDKDVKTLKLFDKLDAVATQLLPYIQNERMRRIHSEVIDDANKLVADEATNRLGKDDTHNFLRKTYKRISDF